MFIIILYVTMNKYPVARRKKRNEIEVMKQFGEELSEDVRKYKCNRYYRFGFSSNGESILTVLWEVSIESISGGGGGYSHACISNIHSLT